MTSSDNGKAEPGALSRLRNELGLPLDHEPSEAEWGQIVKGYNELTDEEKESVKLVLRALARRDGPDRD